MTEEQRDTRTDITINVRTENIKEMEERYGTRTIGDYWRTPEMIEIRVADTGDSDANFLIALHELVEEWLCTKRGIKEKDIGDFDRAFSGDGEPGDDPQAPYYREHQFATSLERLMCHELGIKWHDYEGKIYAIL